MKKLLKGILKVLLCFSPVLIILAILIAIGIYETQPKVEQEEYQMKYKDFKNDTEIVKGSVKETKTTKKVGILNDYNLVVENDKGNRKMIKVSENQFRNYQKNANVNFRINRKKHNKVVLDLGHHKDVHNWKEFRDFYSKNTI